MSFRYNSSSIAYSSGLREALLWFDFVLTFPKEVRCIWGRRFTGATLVYLCTRYFALFERIFFILTVLFWSSTDAVSLVSRFAYAIVEVPGDVRSHYSK